MANKTFKDFTQIGKNEGIQEVDLKPTGDEEIYLVGYQVTPSTNGQSSTSQEIRVEVEDYIKKAAQYFDISNVSADAVQYNPQTGGTAQINSQTVTEKLNTLLTTDDYITSTGETPATQTAKGNRLFIGNGQTAVVTVGAGGAVLADYTSIQAALNDIAKWHIESGSLVIIRVLTDIEVSTSINVNHPQGERIHIIGSNAVGGGYTQISISTTAFGENQVPNFNLFECTDGHRIGLIDKFRLVGRPINFATGWGAMTGKAAIRASRQAYINVGSNITIQDWYYGILAEYGSAINATQTPQGISSGVIISNTGMAGIAAMHGSHINATKANVSNSRLTGALGYGILASHGSQVVCDGATVSSNERAGVASFSGSEICAMGVISQNNGFSGRNVYGAGFLASDGGYIECSNLIIDGVTTNTQALTNYGFAFEYLKGGSISGNTGSSTGNTLGITNKFALSTTKNSLAALEANDTTVGVYTTKGQQVEIASPPSESTTRLVLTGGVANLSPSIAAAGTEAKIDIQLAPKGTGGRVLLGQNVSFGSMTNFVGSIPPIAGAVGYISITDNAGNTRRLVVY
jgi:hypothetical protein